MQEKHMSALSTELQPPLCAERFLFVGMFVFKYYLLPYFSRFIYFLSLYAP